MFSGRLTLLAALLLAASHNAPAAEDPADLYLQFYFKLQEAERAEKTGRLPEALATYRDAAAVLQQLRLLDPTYRPDLVTFRTQFCQDKIAALDAAPRASPDPAPPAEPRPAPKQPDPPEPPPETDPVDLAADAPPAIEIPPPPERAPPEPTPSDSPPPRVDPVPEPAPTESVVASPSADDAVVPFSAIPPPSSAPASDEASEDDPLRAQLANAQSQLAKALGDAATSRRLLEQSQQATRDLQRKIDRLQGIVVAGASDPAAAAEAAGQIKSLRSDLETARTRTRQLEENLTALSADKEKVDSELAALRTTPAPDLENEVASLKTERDELKSQLMELQNVVATLPADTNVAPRIVALTTDLAKVRSEVDRYQLENQDLRSELGNIKARVADGRIEELIRENDDLKSRLKAAETQLASFTDNSSSSTNSALAATERLVRDSDARIRLLEADLAKLQSENREYQRSIAQLQQRLARAESSTPSAAPDQVQREKDILRAIVQRQLDESRRRDSAAAELATELERRKIDSDVVRRQIEILTSPVTLLTPQEQELLQTDLPLVVSGSPTSPRSPLSEASPLPSRNRPMSIDSEPPPAPPLTPIPESVSESLPESGPLPDPPLESPDPIAEEPADPEEPGTSEDLASGPTEIARELQASPEPETALGFAVPPVMEPVAREATELFVKGEFERAAEKYEQILAEYPDNVFALSNLGVVRYSQDRYEEAEEILLKAIKLSPQDAFSHSALGIVYFSQGSFNEAVGVLTRAATLDPRDPQTHNYLGIACSKKGWHSVAEEELLKAIELKPDYGHAHFNLAIVYATQRPPSKDRARQHYERARSLGIGEDPELEKLISD